MAVFNGTPKHHARACQQPPTSTGGSKALSAILLVDAETVDIAGRAVTSAHRSNRFRPSPAYLFISGLGSYLVPRRSCGRYALSKSR